MTDEPGGNGERRRDAVLEPQQAFLELGRIDLAAMPLGQVLRRVAELAKATIQDADEVSVTLLDRNAPRSLGFTGELAVHLDERQYADGFGPCLDAARNGQVVDVADTEDDERYPDLCGVAARTGIRSILSVGLRVPERPRGGINLYSSRRGALSDPATVQLASAFVDYAAVVLANAALVDSERRLAQSLEQAMASRAVIEQAKGILMSRTGCSAGEAFVELARRSQQENRKLRDLAAELVGEVAATAEKG